MKIVIATSNKGKIKEFKEILEPLGYIVLMAQEMNIDLSDVIENGKTFKENALIKARILYERTRLLSIADDSGLVINALPNILGIHSARFMGENTDYKIKNNEIIKLLENKSNREAAFYSVIAIVDGIIEETFEGICEGEISHEPKGELGFGYDPIFIPKGYNKTFALLGAEIKNNISHRAIAIKKLVRYLKNEK